MRIVLGIGIVMDPSNSFLNLVDLFLCISAVTGSDYLEVEFYCT